jgi:hypothetical protein
MLPKHAFLDADGIVLNLIVGSLTPSQQQLFLRDQATMFGATQVIEVEPGTSVWIGGSYTDGVFMAPPQPEPAPEIIEGVSEILPEPQLEPLPEVITETII